MFWGRFLWEISGGRWDGSIEAGKSDANPINRMGIGR